MKKSRIVLSVLIIVLLLTSFLTGCIYTQSDEKVASDNTESVTVSSKTSEVTSYDSSSESVSSLETVSEKSDSISSSSISSKYDKPKSESSQASKDADMSFFDDAVFVGDSITLGLRNYVKDQRKKGKDCLGEAQFLVAGSMGYSNTLYAIGSDNAIQPIYKGTKVHIEDGVKQMGAKKVFVMLGMNDFCAYPTEKGVANAKTCLERICQKNPDVLLYVESVTPTVKDRGSFNNKKIELFNDGLKELCAENDWTYVDVASVMKDDDGKLIASYCSDSNDKGVHMTYTGCAAWVSYLCELFC